MPATGIVHTIGVRCKRCYTCVRSCPSRAVKVEGGQAKVIEERCIACGYCVKVCAQSAKEIESGLPAVEQMLRAGEAVYAILAPSAPAAFYPICLGQVVTAVRQLGFAAVLEVAFGAQLVARRYAWLAARQSRGPIVTTPCPAIVAYVEKYVPELIPSLAPIVSPAVALGRMIKQRYNPRARVVFVGPCVAKKAEIKDPDVAGALDAALTFVELKQLFARRDIRPAELPESEFDGPHPGIARLFPLSGGLLRSAGLVNDLTRNDVIVTEGKDNCVAVLREMATGRLEARFLDILFCEGCIDGPHMDSDLSLFQRKEVVANYVAAHAGRQSPEELEAVLQVFDDLDLGRTFTDRRLTLPVPTQEEIEAILRKINKTTKEDELNCGACGYPTCRDKAVAVYQGLAEVEMCLPYLIDQLEANLRELERFQRELQSAQEQLIQSEKLASMGQLAAGVAHELNNPLGSILLYAHLLLKDTSRDNPHWSDLKLIVDETTRCKHIVSGLLDFARQRQLALQPTDLNALVDECLARLAPQLGAGRVTVVRAYDPELPRIAVDPAQLSQVVLNVCGNAIDAMPRGGQLTITTRLTDDGRAVQLAIADTGRGIPAEQQSKIFSPFYTTKPSGQGTGLGLAITYGIVKMHRGSIGVTSQVGVGTTFTITLPANLEARSVARGEVIG